MSEDDIKKAVEGAEIIDFTQKREEVKAGKLDEELSRFDNNDYGNGQRLIRRYGDSLIYVFGRGWYVWDGKRWQMDQESLRSRLLAHKTAQAIKSEWKTMNPRKMIEEAQKSAAETGQMVDYQGIHKAVEAHRKWASSSGSQARASAMLVEAAPYLCVSVDQLDADDYLVSVENGTLELNSAGMEDKGYVRLRCHDQDDRITAKMEVVFDADVDAPLWRKFMQQILPDEEVRLFVQRYFGYILTGDQGEQCLCLFYGGGANGKSTLMDVIAEVMGDYTKTLPFASLLHNDNQRGSEASPDLARLPGARYVQASEPDAGVRFSESLIKTVTGGEKITTRMLNKDFFEFRPQFKLVLAFNNRPGIRGADHGIWRRIMMVPFEVSIPKEEQDSHLKEKLLQEKSGILNWMLDGYRMWRDTGLAAPDAVKAATEQYKDEQNPLGVFVRDCLVKAQGQRIAATDLYNIYVLWCRENNRTEMTNNLFGRLLPEQGVEKIKYGKIFYNNVMLSSLGEELRTPAGNENDEI